MDKPMKSQPHADLDVDRIAPEVQPGLRLLPVVHDRIEMAGLVAAILRKLEPAAVAVELPATLSGAVVAAARRLPQVSIVLSEELDEEPKIWICAPGDPFAEALRWALDRDAATFFIDPDIPGGEPAWDSIPDPWALWAMPPEDYLALLKNREGAAQASSVQSRREAGMAHFLAQATRSTVPGTLLALIGAAHVGAVENWLATATATPLARTRRTHVELRNLHPESLSGVLPDPPLAHAGFELLRQGPPPTPPPLERTLPQRVALRKRSMEAVTRGTNPAQTEARRHRIANFATAHSHRLFHEAFPLPDRRMLQAQVWRLAAAAYQQQTGERVKPWQRDLFFDYSRRQTQIQGVLAAGLYEWVVAARGVGDDNLAWEVFEVGRAYPWQRDTAEIPTARIDGDQLDLGTRKIHFRRRFFKAKQKPLIAPVRRRPQTENPEDWIDAFDVSGICSHPPEDLVIEDYARFLQRKAVSILSTERKRTEPFTVSLLDGIDIRETLRHLHEGRVQVQELGRAPGKSRFSRGDFRPRSGRGAISILHDLAGRAPAGVGHGLLRHQSSPPSRGAGDHAGHLRRLHDDLSSAAPV